MMGLVTHQQFDTPELTNPLSLAAVVHASLIKQTIEMLPAPEDPAAQAKTLELTPIPPNARTLQF